MLTGTMICGVIFCVILTLAQGHPIDQDDTMEYPSSERPNTAGTIIFFSQKSAYEKFMENRPSYAQVMMESYYDDMNDGDVLQDETQALSEDVINQGKRSQGGETYIRWGRTTCPKRSGTTQVYTGWAAGSHYGHRGGGANYLCLTETPQYLKFSTATNNNGILFGAEYEASKDLPYGRLHDHDVPCSVCHVAQRSVLMIPGQYTCPSGWRREYYGYLVSAHHAHHRSMYECMDESAQGLRGGHINHNGALFYHVEARCGSLYCPPYENTKELTCAVCSK